jgi:hypothetical protein
LTTPSWLRSSADVSLGLAGLLASAGASGARRNLAVASPVLRVVARDVVLLTGSSRRVRELQARGELLRERTRIELSRLLDRMVPVLLASILRRMDLTAVVHEQVDIDRLVKDVDVDGVASRLDLDAVVQRVDVDAVVQRVDLDTIVQRLDLTGIVLDRVDMERVVQEVLSHVDIIGIAEYVVDAIDLPQIVRDSSGALTSDTVRGVRMRGVAGDRAIRRMRDRMLRRGGTSPEAPDAEDPLEPDGPTTIRPGRQ